jgi:tRNA1Val (adenine37-N6)-methyltransferase
MKVGTDGVLLGAWTAIGTAKRVADLGAGTGLISLMIAQESTAFVTAIEIDEASAKQCDENFKNSPWAERLQVVKQDVFRYEPTELFDVVVSNPPYHVENILSPRKERALARSAEIPLHFWLEKAFHLCHEDGVFSWIIPAHKEEEILHQAQRIGWFPDKITRVKPNKHKPSVRTLFQFRKKKTELLSDELIIETEQRGIYTEAYRSLCKAYYLKF